jgi:LacI family transcriptional regulator
MARITQAQLASEVGVDRSTVSLVYSNPAKVRDRTRQQVLDAAHRLGYRPNAAARATSRGRFGTVSLVLSMRAGRSHLPPEMFGGLLDALDDVSLNLHVSRLPDVELEDPTSLPRLLREASSDGLLIDYTHNVPPKLLAQLQRPELPLVWINTRRPHDAVFSDDHAGSLALTEHLLTLGHRRIVYVNSTIGSHLPDLHYSVTDRRSGYEQAMRAAGLAPVVHEVHVHETHPGPQRYDQARTLMHGPDRPTALIGYGDSVLIPYSRAAGEAGLRLPADVSFATFGESNTSIFGPITTTVLLPAREVGRQAAAMLHHRIDHPDQPAPSITVPPRLEVGGSTVPPPA